MTEQALLQATDLEIIDFLRQLSHHEIAKYHHALILLWQMHTDTTIKEHAEQLLKASLTKDELEAADCMFQIFETVFTHSDSSIIQQKNYYNFEQEKAPYESLLLSSAFFIERYLDLGRRLYLLFDLPKEAKACFETILLHQPQHAEALYALGRLVEHEGNYNVALGHYCRCIEQEPTHIYAHLQSGIVKMKYQQAYEEAIEHYQTVLEIDPFMTEAYVHMAEAQRALGDLSRAKQFIDMALGIHSHQEEALNLLGRIQWMDENDVEAALATFEKGVDHPIHGDSGLLLSSLGQLYQEQLGDYEKARLYYEKALAVKLEQQGTFRQLMNLLEEQYQDYGAMGEYYERYLSTIQKEPSILTDYASFAFKYLNDIALAQAQLEKALELDDDYSPAIALSLQLLQQSDEEEELLDDWEDDDFLGGGAIGDN